MAFRFSLPVYSAVFLGSQRDLEASDKIILPDRILQALLERYFNRMPYPVIFKVTNTALSKASHCGVLEFTSPNDAAYLPSWMMENMLVSDGIQLEFVLTDLPKLTSVKFQPTEYAFTEILDPRATLEVALSKFTSLTLGDVIPLQYFNKVFHLTVVTLTPDDKGTPPAGCLVDTTLNVDFAPPVEEPKDVVVPVDLNKEYSGALAPDEFAQYKLKITDPSKAVLFEVTAMQGSPDLYVSTSPNPHPTTAFWKYGSGKESGGLRVEPKDAKFSKNWYFFCMHSYKEPGAFKFKVSQVDARVESELEEKKTGAMSRVDSKIQANDPNYKRCENCHRLVPVASFTMHSLSCARNNWFCPECRKAIPRKEKDLHVHCPICNIATNKDELEKHKEFTHGDVSCECGSNIPRDLYSVHKEFECLRRIVSCRYCGTKLPFAEKSDHEVMCGGRSINCEVCNTPIPRRRMEIHLAAAHRINPCVDSSGNRRTVKENDASSTTTSSAVLPDLGLSAEEQAFLKALSESRNAIQASEDELLAQAMALSAKEAGLSPRNAPRSASPRRADHSPAFKDSDNKSEVQVFSDLEDNEWDDTPAVNDLDNYEDLGVVEDEMVAETECPVCGEMFAVDKIDIHFQTAHKDVI